MNRSAARLLEPVELVTEYRERVWGGKNLNPLAGETAGAGSKGEPIGEAWLVYEGNRVASGPLAGRTLGELAAEYGETLLGRKPLSKTGTRFPLLIKLLDCADWLSVQVHPGDENAAKLEGPGNFGKTEAWYVLKAAPGATLISGLRPGTDRETMAKAIRDGSIADLAHYQPVHAGDSVFTPAGTIHALGPGLLIYEIQQTSDITYRVFDWNRPQETGRSLHIEQSIEVADPSATAKYIPASALREDGKQRLISCAFFSLDLLQSSMQPIFLDTNGESFAVVTAIEGELELEGAGWSHTLSRYSTMVVPACCGSYQLYPHGEFRALLARVE